MQLSGALPTAVAGAATQQPSPGPSDAGAASGRALRILVLGGTGFIGPHTIRAALGRGHEVTMFNRGRTNPGIFPDVERLIGDRNDDLTALENRSWDVVLDLPATNPKWVELSAQLLKDAANQYVHISSESVYSDTSVTGINEDSPVFRREDVELPEDGRLPYGLSKVLAENEARRAFGDRATIIRPGLIVGPGDPTDRFTYWPARIDRGGEIAAPGDGTDFTQIIDARDLASFLIHMVETSTMGTFNASGPESPMTMAEMLYGIRAVTTGEIGFTWIPWEFLEEKGIRPWADMPAWVPSTPEMIGFSTFSQLRALAAGLTLRPLADTARDTIEWHNARPEEERTQMRSGLSRANEAELLRAWHASRGAPAG